MAKVKLNPVMEQMRGKIGDLVFKRYEDEVIVSRKSSQTGATPTAGQAAHRERFRLAAVYASGVFAVPEDKKLYEDAANARHKPAFSVAVGDFLNAPTIDVVDLAAYTGKVGDPIVIRASDDFEVVSVTVVVRNAERGLLEQGPATLVQGSWRYVAQTTMDPGLPLVIDVTATDRPGNKTVKTLTKA
jgi:hypothetical protein